MSPVPVSVVIGTYNRAGVIRQTLDSVLQQSFRDFDVWVVDDASTDETVPVVRSYGDRVKLIERKENSGSPSLASTP